ncbi:PilC/PilY family type IV pilus protein [Pseudoduganella sp. SL102]|uniref:pilus assembly protein n=1 Tax=Pseudoduganella sp. SL102 TaxID=2995154 RepID=UPI00248AA3C3|nr:PilC/PilY family type IV pilus protein [Pseudoduganella sp. SL102]WBS04619.1 PilC/PilY family type IV pilus protein [Pseudoduganella sp. SL102]
MGSSSSVAMPSRGGPGAPSRRHLRGCISPRLAPNLALAVAAGLALCCAVGLPMGSAHPPPVALDDQPAALACKLHRTVQGPPVAIPTAPPPPSGTGTDGAPSDAGIFRVTYDLAAGSGTLHRLPLVQGEDGDARLLAPLWDAAAVLATTPPAARRIFTSHGDGPRAGTTVPFDWAWLSPSQQEALDRPPGGTAGDGLGPDRVAWLRVDRTLEGGTFRARAGLLGDAVHATPLYLAAGANLHGDAAYAAFQAGTLRRPPAVYLGANDGMLHAFDAGTGAELFAYVPAKLVPVLNQLPAPGYTHRAYVDGPLAAGEALVRGAWRSVLVGAPGAGGRGLFALDVTDPAAFDPASSASLGALWEFTERDDAAIGHVMQPAQVTRLQLRTRHGKPEYRHFAVAGNGMNGRGAAGALFLLALDKQPAERWRLGGNYHRLDTPPGDPALPAGLGAAAPVTDAHHVLRHAYAGDLQGRLWRFDFTRNAPWRTDPAMQPVFVARDADGRPQPITQPPRIVHAEGGGYLVLFGTGSLYGREERDPARFAPQSYYAVYDDPAATPGRPLDRADLLERRAEGVAGGAHVILSGRAASVGPGDRARGWYFDFADGATSGERSVAPGTIADGKLVFATVVPGGDPCADSASRTYVLDALAGWPADASGAPLPRGVTGVLVSDLIHGPPMLLPGRRTLAPRDPTGRIQVARDTAVVRFGTQGGPVAGGTSSAGWPAGRLAWREVANWRQLHRKATQGERP